MRWIEKSTLIHTIHPMKKIKIWLIILLSIPLIISNVTPGFAQGSSAWPPIENIPGIADDTWTPILVPDPYGTIHAFYYQWLDESHTKRAIIYNKWTKEQGWTPPVDILLSPIKNDARLLDAYLDHSEIVHVIFWGGESGEANIYYSNANLSDVANARSWLNPILVAENAQDPPIGQFFVDNQGNYRILFGGAQDGIGLYLTESSDHGKTWSKPTRIFEPSDDKRSFQNLNTYEGESGWIHAIWNEITPQGQGRKILYSHVRRGESNWSDPIVLAESESGYGTNVPNIIEHAGNVFAIHFQTIAEGNHKIEMRLSKDEGFTWEEPEVLFPRHTGVSGNLTLAVDSNDTLHMFFIQRIPGMTIGPDVKDIGGIWHSVFNDGHWSNPQMLTFANNDKPIYRFAYFEPNAVISQGNQILLIWMTDPGSMGNGVWYSTYTLDAPELPVETLKPPQTVIPTISTTSPYTPTMTEVAEKTVTFNPVGNSSLLPPPSEESSNASLITILSIGLFPAILVITIVIFVRSKSRSTSE